MTRKKSIFLIILIAIIAFFVGLWFYHNTRPQVLALTSATILPQPLNIAAFKLEDKNQQPFSNQNFQRQWSFVFFGFTHCPYMCPTTLTMLKQLYRNLQNDKIQPLPQIVFITVDPERDSSKALKDYLQNFNSAFEGATGSKAQIDALTKQFNVVYAKIFLDGDKTHYSIDHSGTIILVNPKGQIFAIFSAPYDPLNIAKDYEKIIQH